MASLGGNTAVSKVQEYYESIFIQGYLWVSCDERICQDYYLSKRAAQGEKKVKYINHLNQNC